MTARTTTLEIDDRELAELQLDLREAAPRVQLGATKTLRRGAEIVNRGMTKDAKGHRYLPYFSRGITHELLDRVTAEIGFERSEGEQHSLVWIILNGSVNNFPVYDKFAALRRSTPAILEMFGGMAEDAVLGSREA
jgi:hypothetical protein